MPSLTKTAASLLVIAALLLASVGFAQATTMTLNVKAGGATTKPVTLAEEDRVLIQYKIVSGETTKTLQFTMTFPNGTVKDFGNSGDFLYRFTCDSEGEYKLIFNNTEGADNVQVTLNYEIDHYILGIPQMLFMVILIAGVSLVGVAIFIGLSKKP